MSARLAMAWHTSRSSGTLGEIGTVFCQTLTALHAGPHCPRVQPKRYMKAATRMVP